MRELPTVAEDAPIPLKSPAPAACPPRKKPAIKNHVLNVSRQRLKIINRRLQTRFGMTSCAVNPQLRFQIKNLML
jgi:hypothetical protein